MAKTRIDFRKAKRHPAWNLFILTIGSACTAFGVQAISVHLGTLTGGVLGLGQLAWYASDKLSAPVWYLLFNIPLFVFSWFSVSKRFVFYSLYGMLSVFFWSLPMGKMHLPIEDPLYATIVAGVLIGTGGGIMLKSLGSAGGLDLLAVYLNEKFNLAVGQFSLIFNGILFLASITTISLDLVVLSFIQLFISASMTDVVVRMFNQRKIVMIITDKGQEVCGAIIKNGGRATLWPAYGGYSHEPKEIVMTVTTSFTLRYLEDIVFTMDRNALFAVESSFYVVGAQFPRVSK